MLSPSSSKRWSFPTTQVVVALVVAVLSNSAIPGTAAEPGYCLYAPNDNCWPQGWPDCCLDDTDANCPAEQPNCEVMGASICVRAPNTNCFAGNGFPSCCETSPDTCPSDGTYPPCDITPLVGASYCTFSPSTSCWVSGWPSCCAQDPSTCPETEPLCDVPTDRNFCTYAPNYQCWTGGHPECCATGSTECPEAQPACTVTPVNDMETPCQGEADFTCYKNGFPACCQQVSPVCGDQASGDLNCDLLYASGTGASEVTGDGVDQATVGGQSSSASGTLGSENPADNTTATTTASLAASSYPTKTAILTMMSTAFVMSFTGL